MFLLSGVCLIQVNTYWVCPFVLIGVGIAFLLEPGLCAVFCILTGVSIASLIIRIDGDPSRNPAVL